MANDSRLAALTALVAAFLISGAALGEEPFEPRVELRRHGVVMGLDPGLALRMEESGLPLYARMDLRIGGCIRPWFQLGGDIRGDLLVTMTRGASQRRYEIGPVATFYLFSGWFTRLFVHFAGTDPVSITAGGQTGYEFSTGKYTAVGFYMGADAQIPFDGRPPIAYDFSAGFYFSAYDLAQRKGRDPGGY
jgi:hypothetical protein